MAAEIGVCRVLILAMFRNFMECDALVVDAGTKFRSEPNQREKNIAAIRVIRVKVAVILRENSTYSQCFSEIFRSGRFLDLSCPCFDTF